MLVDGDDETTTHVGENNLLECSGLNPELARYGLVTDNKILEQSLCQDDQKTWTVCPTFNTPP